MKPLLSFLAATAAATTVFTTALAGGLPDLGSGRVTDYTGTLDDGDIEDIEAALANVEEEENVDLFVLFIESAGGADLEFLADDIASAEGLGGDDALLLVVTEERVTRLFVSDGIGDEISDDELDQVIDDVNDNFAEGDFAEGVITAGERLGEAVSGDALGGGDGSDSDDGGGISFGTIIWIFIGGTILVLAGLWLFGLWQGQRGKKRAEEEKDRQTGELAKRANSALIETDESLREGEQELGFAEAQFNESDVKPFREALAAAREDLNQAFTIRQQLDDAQPDDPDTRRKMLEEILALCDKARAAVNQQKERLRQLRELEKNAPAVLAELPNQINQLEQRAESVYQTFERLQGYNPDSWAAVRGNGTEAEKRLVFAEKRVAAGDTALAQSDRRSAASAASQAQTAVAEADALLDAIDHMESSLNEARTNLGGELEAARADVGRAREYLASAQNLPDRERLGTALATAQDKLEWADRESRKDAPDYLAAIRNAREANAGADDVLADAREASEKQKRAEDSYRSTLRDAGSSYQRAEDFIGGRRRGIGNSARTRLSEARRHLEQARGLGPTEAGLKEAQAAERLADEAYNDARGDFDDYDRGGIFGGFGLPIPIPFPTGGGGWGGTRWGGSGGGGGIRIGRSRGGSFGGSRGGGGRSRGGRW